MIDQSNYEAFLLDYLEGSLDAEQVSELMRFLKANPDIKVETESFDAIGVSADPSLFMASKEELKRDEDGFTSVEVLLLRAMDDDLSEAEKIHLQSELELNRRLQRDWEALNNTVVGPEFRITYPDKQRLKRGERVVFIIPKLIKYVSIAASVAITGYLFWPQTHPVSDREESGASHAQLQTPVLTKDAVNRNNNVEPKLMAGARPVSNSVKTSIRSDSSHAEVVEKPPVKDAEVTMTSSASLALKSEWLPDTSVAIFEEEILSDADWNELIEIGADKQVEIILPEKNMKKIIRLLTGVRTSESVSGPDGKTVLQLEAGTLTARYVRSGDH